MTSAICTVNGLSTVGGVDVADDLGTVTIQLVDLAAEEWSISVVGTDDLVATPSLSINYTTKTATFTKPAGPWSLILQSQVDNGKDINQKPQPTYTTTFKISVLASGALRLLASNERAEGSASFGWITVFNALVHAGGGSSSSGFSSVLAITGTGTTVLTPTTGRNLVTLASVTGALVAEFPAAPTVGCSFLFKLKDTSMTLSSGAHTFQVNGNGHHVEFEGSNDAGGTDLSPVFGIDNFGSPGGGAIEYAWDGSTWLSV
jgi:hypothetical protein